MIPNKSTQGAEVGTAAVLNFAHRLLSMDEAPPASDPTFLQELCQAFGSLGAGVAKPGARPGTFDGQCWFGGARPPGLLYPWEINADLFSQAALDPLTSDTVIVTDKSQAS